MSTTEQTKETIILKTNPLINAFATVCRAYGLLNDLRDLPGYEHPSYSRRLGRLESEAQELAKVAQQMIRQRKQEALDNEL